MHTCISDDTDIQRCKLCSLSENLIFVALSVKESLTYLNEPSFTSFYSLFTDYVITFVTLACESVCVRVCVFEFAFVKYVYGIVTIVG